MYYIKAKEPFIKGYANSKYSSFLIPNATEDFLIIRPSGNPISAKNLVGIFENKDLVAESSELLKPHKIEIFGKVINAVFTLNEIFILKVIKTRTFQHIHAFLIPKMIFGNIIGCKDHKDLLI